MRKQLLKDSAVYIAGSIIVQIFSLVGLLSLMHFLPVASYGKYIYIIEFISIFAFFSDGGFTQHIIKEVSQKPDQVQKIYTSAQSAQLIISSIMLLLIAAISYFGNAAQDFYYLLIFGLSVVISASFSPMLAILIASGRKDLIFYKDLAGSMLKLAFMLGGIYFKAPFLYFICLGFINCFILLALFCYLKVMKKYVFYLKFKKDIGGSINFIRNGALFTLLMAANIVYNKIDIVMLEKIIGSTEVGFYSGATRFIYPFMFISTAFMTAIFPSLAKYAANKKEFKNIQYLATYYLGAIGILLSVVLYFGSSYIFPFFFDQKYNASIPVFKILVWYLALVFIYGSISNNLVAKGKVKFLVYLNISMIVLNVVLNFILIPKHGAKGAAIATISCEILILVLSLCYWNFVVQREKDAEETATTTTA